MISKNFSLRVVAAVALLGLSGVSQAALTVYTDEASFMAAVINAGTDDFSTAGSGNIGASYAGSTAGGAYTYAASAPLSLYVLDTLPTGMSVDSAADTITFGNFAPVGGSVKAVGGTFFNTNASGAASDGNLTITGYDFGAQSSSMVINSTTSSFVGFVSTGAMTALTVVADNSIAVDPGLFYPTVGKLVLASAPVPEPETYALMLAGLGLVGFMARRRRS